MGDTLYAEMEETWGKRAARGMKTCSRGRETLAQGLTGAQNLAAQPAPPPAPEAVFMRELAAAREATDAATRERRASAAAAAAAANPEGSRAAQKRRKRGGHSTSPAPPADRNGPALREASGNAAATPREKSGKPSAKKQKKSPDKHSMFLTSPTSHLLGGTKAKAPPAPAPVSGAPRMIGDGLWVRDTVVGAGELAGPTTSVGVLYSARLHASRKRFDHRSNPNSPFNFALGRRTVVDGFERGLIGMRVGGEREVVVPPDLAYGADGAPPKVPPNATLLFTIKLVRVGDVAVDAAGAKAPAAGGKPEATLRRRARGARGGARAHKKRANAAGK